MAQVLPSASSQSLSPSSAAPTEYCVLLMGTWHKQPLFHQMQMAAHKFEQHIQYADTCYLTFQFGSETIVLELIDPGTEHTGAREMSIRKADAAILCYAAYSPASFHTLASIAEDFKCLEEGGQPASLLLCNEDQLVEHSEPDEGEKTDGSEGYGSASNSPPEEPPPMQSPRRRSMERIRLERDEGQCPVTREQGEQLARQFGDQCEFLALSFGSIQPNLPQMIQKLIQRAKQHRQSRERSRSRSRTNSRRLSPIIPILRRTSLKKLLSHSKSDASRKESAEMANNSSASSTDLADEGNGRKRNSTRFGNALRVLVHPRERTKSQNKVAAANENEITKSTSTEGAGQSETAPRTTPFGLEVIPPTPSAEPFAFDPVRVNNFVGNEEGGERQQTNTKRGSLANAKTAQTNQQKGGYRLRTISTPTSSAACTIQ